MRSMDSVTHSLYTHHMSSHDDVTSVDTSSGSSMAKRVRAELQPSRLLPNLTSGVVVGLIVVNVAISVATLVFQGELQQFLAQGIGLALFSGVLVSIVTSVSSSYPGMVGQAQDRVAPGLAVIAGGVAAQMAGVASSEAIFLTVVAALALTGISTGLLLTLLGAFKMGNLIRFIPYPVIGGFLGGTGYLLVKGSLDVMTTISIDGTTLGLLFEGEVLPLWLVGVAYGVVLTYASSRYQHFLVMPGLLLGGMGLFHLVAWGSGTPMDDVRAAGWLLGTQGPDGSHMPFPPGGSWSWLTPEAVMAADWSVVMGQSSNMLTIFLIALVSVLLNAGALELAVKSEIDLNQELRAAGVANLFIGGASGTVGFQSLSMSRLVHRMGSKSRIVGFVGAVVCVAVLASGTSVLSLLPRAVLGGLLFFLGAQFLLEWLYDAYSRLTRSDYGIVLLITLTIAVFGYKEGVAVGLVACVLLFLFSYSQVDVVRMAIGGNQLRSNVERPIQHVRLLEESGDQIQVYKLQGYIFFGTANGLYEQMRALVAERPAIRYLVFDFSRVTGIDSSCVLSFVKTRQLAENGGFTLVFIRMSDEIRDLLDREKFSEVPDEVFRTFTDLDYALEWCENELLASSQVVVGRVDKTSFIQQLALDLDDVEMQTLLAFFERRVIAPGTELLRQSDVSTALYLIDRGQVTTELSAEDGTVTRLRTTYSGTIVGEMGLILRRPRSASVVASQECVVFELTQEGLEQMERQAPRVAMMFHHFLTPLLAERLSNSNRMLQSLQE